MLKLLIAMIFTVNIKYIHSKVSEKQRLIVVAIDGLQPDDITEERTPHLHYLKNDRFSATVKGSFPTQTLSSLHTISTGMHPKDHGVITSNYFNRTTKKEVHNSYELYHYREDITPIWILNELQGGVSGCACWPGSNYTYHGKNCTYSMDYLVDHRPKDLIGTPIKWLNFKEKPANLVMIYIGGLIKLRHVWGVDSKEYREKMREVDKAVMFIDAHLNITGVTDTNVIHLTVHGITDITPANYLNISEHLEKDSYKWYGKSPIFQVVPSPGKFNIVLAGLKDAKRALKHFDYYFEHNLPERWKCTHRRLGPIVIVSHTGYAFDDMFITGALYESEYGRPFDRNGKYGIDGYDNENDKMKSFYMANGPYFKKGSGSEIQSVSLFKTFEDILGLEYVAPKSKGVIIESFNFVIFSIALWNSLIY